MAIAHAILVLMPELVFKATLLLAGAVALLAALPRLSAARRHLVLACALGSVGALPALVVVVPSWNVTAPMLAWVGHAPFAASDGFPATEIRTDTPAGDARGVWTSNSSGSRPGHRPGVGGTASGTGSWAL